VPWEWSIANFVCADSPMRRAYEQVVRQVFPEEERPFLSTGMGRRTPAATAYSASPRRSPPAGAPALTGLEITGVFSRFATEDTDLNFAREQLARFESVPAFLLVLRSLCFIQKT